MIPSDLVPVCPVCGSNMEINVRKDNYFVEDEAQHYKIKKQNSKIYYITFTEPYKFFKEGFYKVKKKFIFFAVKNMIGVILNEQYDLSFTCNLI